MERWSISIADLPCGIPLCGLAEGAIPQGKGMGNADCGLQFEVSDLGFIFSFRNPKSKIPNFTYSITPTFQHSSDCDQSCELRTAEFSWMKDGAWEITCITW
jgi:hypothetical protein